MYQGNTEDPCDVDDFNPDLYLDKLLKECSLTELMDREHEMYKQIQALDSEMQTLVYENYNKFISATDTIRKMKKDLKKMEEEMDGLATNMASISQFSGQISGTLQGRREHMARLSGTHTLLKKLQLLFQLPPRLKACMERQAYGQAVKYYTRAEAILHQYHDMPSFHGIHHDCNLIVTQLKERLKEQLNSPGVTPRELAHLVQLLFELQEPTEALCADYLLNAGKSLEADLEVLQQVTLQEDILQFMDLACNRFVRGLCNVTEAYLNLFVNQLPVVESWVVRHKLESFVETLMRRYLAVVAQRLATEKCCSDNSILVKALDRFCQRLEGVAGGAYVEPALHIAREAVRGRCSHALQALCQFFSQHLTDVRQDVALRKDNLAQLHGGLRSAVLEQVGQVLAGLQAFVQADVSFAQEDCFREPFCLDVRERVVVAFVRHINQSALEFCGQPSGLLLLLLSRLSLDMKTSMVNQMLEMVDEHFPIAITPASTLVEDSGQVAQTLLDDFVRAQGLIISQMLRKSVETRDWLHTLEPRTVRAVMKRVVEDVTVVDMAVGQLYEEGTRKQRSSDSSRRTYPYSASGRAARGGRWASVDHSLLSNIQKLFLEKIDIFTTVDFSRVSVMTGIIKIGLKTYLECIRLKTFSRFGLQQVQVDTHYLQLYLWRFVSDENLVHVLLDEIMGSAIHRCLDPVLMEPSVVEVICERG
ncbi:vacuolar protein sorting-associated protein 51 homolog [Ornithodoros turicata]|uniref:vacuolar protein sorting-associated protein 51 homolog n=1 Tax=Ornithodoros turicata TaxID=34597 RepID=UPI0031397076